MRDANAKWYSAKIDWWIALILCLPPAAAVTVFIRSLLFGELVGLAVGIGMTFCVGCIYFGLLFPMRYGLSDEQFLVRSGIFSQGIPLNDISEVRPTFNPLSSPALSIDRLRIQYGQAGGKAVMIAPADRGRFLDELAEKTGLERKGDRLFRQ